MTAIKWAGKSRDKIEGLLAPFGGPEYLAGKDLDGEFFTADTDFALTWFGDYERPLLYHHGLDSEIKTSVVGRIAVKMVDAGLWMQAQLDKASEYYDAIAQLVDKKALGLSSGSVSHLVEVDHKSGEIKAWPLIEGSLTPTPANPDARAYSIKSEDAVAHLAVIGTEAPDALKSDEPEPEPPPAKAIQTFSDVIAATEMDEELPEAFQTLQSAISGAIWAWDGDAPATPEAKRAAIAQSLAEFGEYVVGILDKAGKSVPPMPSPMKALTPQALHDAAVASGAACEHKGEMEAKSEPAPLLAVAGKSAEPEPAIDLAALQARLSAKAVAVAKELLG